MINERETRIRKSWMELARAVIEDALEEKDSQFFLDPRSVFPELSKMAKLSKDDLLQYVKNNF